MTKSETYQQYEAQIEQRRVVCALHGLDYQRHAGLTDRIVDRNDIEVHPHYVGPRILAIAAQRHWQAVNKRWPPTYGTFEEVLQHIIEERGRGAR